MKKMLSAKHVLALPVVIASFFALSQVSAHSSTSLFTEEEVEASGCSYTGSTSDYCRHGGYSVQNCKSGSTSCAYDEPQVPTPSN